MQLTTKDLLYPLDDGLHVWTVNDVRLSLLGPYSTILVNLCGVWNKRPPIKIFRKVARELHMRSICRLLFWPPYLMFTRVSLAWCRFSSTQALTPRSLHSWPSEVSFTISSNFGSPPLHLDCISGNLAAVKLLCVKIKLTSKSLRAQWSLSQGTGTGRLHWT